MIFLIRGHTESKGTLEKYRKEFPESFARIMLWLDHYNHPDIFFEAKPSVNKLYDMFCLGTDPAYRRRGIGTELVKQAFKIAKKAKCEGAFVWATSDFSRKIFNNLGMELFHRGEWDSYKLPGSNEPWFEYKVGSECSTLHYMQF